MANLKEFYNDVIAQSDLNVPDAEATTPLVDLLGDDGDGDPILRLVESVEHYNGSVKGPYAFLLPQLSLEGLDAEKKASLISTIIEWLRKLIKALFDEMTGLQAVTEYIVFRANAVKNKARASGRNNSALAGPSFPVTTRIGNLCFRYKPIDNITELMLHLRAQHQLVTAYFNYDPLKHLTEVMHAVAASRDSSVLLAVVQPLAPLQGLSKAGFKAHPENDGWLASPHLLGGQRVVIKQRSTQDPVDNLASQAVRLVPSDTSPKPTPDSIDFLRFGVNQAEQCLTLIGQTASELLKHNTMSVRQQRNSQLEQLTRALKKLEVDSTVSAADGEAVQQIGVTAALVEHYIDWIVNPYNGLYGLTCRNLRAALSVCELNTQ